MDCETAHCYRCDIIEGKLLNHNTMDSFKELLIVIFGVLHLILFFKIWRMTNDIKAIRRDIPHCDKIRDAELAYLNGNPDIAKRILDGCLAAVNDVRKNSNLIEAKMRKKRILETYEYLDLSAPEELL